jgi:GTP-binding protein
LTRLVISAASAADFPRTGIPEVALVGRSNVGKSSLINALVRQKIARTSAAPGKTRLANFYLVDAQPSFYLVDLPGYGYARGGAESVESFEALTRQYFDQAASPERRLTGILQLIDARHPGLRHDVVAHAWVVRHGVPVAVLATKMDKLSRAEQTRHVETLTRSYGALVLPVSSLKGTGLQQIWQILQEWTAQ